MARAERATDRSARRGKVKPEALTGLNLDFSESPTVWKFLQDDSFVRGLMGPVGSGKTFASLAEVMLRAVKQPPSPIDGIRYTRFAVIRNSYPELRTTTIKTWQEIFPENTWGQMRWSPPITHHIKLPPRDGAAGLDCEVIFLALDQPRDVRKLLSLELTGGFIDEARELPKAVVDGLTSRVGRYPTKKHGGCPWRGVWMSTNPMDSDHWWPNLAEKNPIRGKYPWKFYKQPGGVVEGTKEHEDNIFAAGKYWLNNPKAENVNNLPKGYYEQQLAGKTLDWIQCYAGAQYVYVQDGKPVWHEFSDSLMSGDVEIEPALPVHIGLDFGLTPAAVFGQKLPNGRWNVVHELVAFDMGLERFCHHLMADIQTHFPKNDVMIWGDPAGAKRDEIFEVTAFEHLRTLGLRAQPTASNDFMVRREAGAMPMNRLIDGKPGLIVAKNCHKVRKSLAGGYHFKRVAMGGGQERFRDAPNKNEHSHVGDAYGYLMLGGGEHRAMTKNYLGKSQFKQAVANMDFDVF
jgi:hypothetical protein